MLLNAQSIKIKDTLDMEKVTESKTDRCIITETWLKDSDNIWIKSSQMRKNRYDITTANSKGRQGGGLAIVHRSHMAVKCSGRANLRIFEYAIWQAHPNNITLTILAIYHPPYSDTNKAMTSQFTDEFTEFLPKFLMEYSNIIIVADINIQWNNIKNPDTRVHIDTIMTLGLDQHIDFTHKSGSILDHIHTEALSKQDPKLFRIVSPIGPCSNGMHPLSTEGRYRY